MSSEEAKNPRSLWEHEVDKSHSSLRLDTVDGVFRAENALTLRRGMAIVTEPFNSQESAP